MGCKMIGTIKQWEGFDLKERVKLYETLVIREAMIATDGNIAQAAKLIGVKRTTLSMKVKRYGLKQLGD